MARIKKISRALFEVVMDRHWTPVELVEDALPEFAKAVPSEVRFRVLASGEYNAAVVRNYTSKLIPAGELVGGVDVYRNAPDDPVALNKDWYAVVRSPHDPTMLLVDGPIRDDEHWLHELPGRYQGVEVLGVPKQPGDARRPNDEQESVDAKTPGRKGLVIRAV